jgi:RNA polymerase sigma factor (sigma-70 family)
MRVGSSARRRCSVSKAPSCNKTALPIHSPHVRTDAQLLAAAKTDAHAFREVYDRYAEAIHRFHLGRTHIRDAALDLTAETFAQAWLSRGRFKDIAGGSAAPWLFAIASHVLFASVRRQRLERSACERLGILSAVDRADEASEPNELWLEGLDEALASLAPEVREAIRLRVIDDLSFEDVAERTGTSPGAARVRVHRGLAALRNRLLQTREATR